MSVVRITTPRLDLIAATPAMLEAELRDLLEWGAMLNADAPPDWPPEHWDQPAMRYTLEHMLKRGDDVGWGPWYLLLRRDSAGERPIVIGTAGLKGKPTADGTIEIGYGIVPGFRRRGFATEASHAVIDWACRNANPPNPAVRHIVAETYPHLRPSIGVMEKLGMKLIGPGSEDGVIRYGMTAPQPSPVQDAAAAALSGTPCRPGRTAG